jgi:hypothetical protein
MSTEQGWLLVVCDDGSVWMRPPHSPDEQWTRLDPPIPGTMADKIDIREEPS